MTAIVTRYLGVTSHKGARIVAETMAPNPSTGRKDRLTMGYYSTGSQGGNDERHRAVAIALAQRLRWVGKWVQVDAGGSGYVFARVVNEFVIEGVTSDKI